MVVSLAAPLAGHGLTGTQRLALACMHLVVAAVLIPVFALTIAHRRAIAARLHQRSHRCQHPPQVNTSSGSVSGLLNAHTYQLHHPYHEYTQILTASSFLRPRITHDDDRGYKPWSDQGLYPR